MSIGESSKLAQAIFAASHESQSSALYLVRMLPYVPKGSQSSIADTGMQRPDDVATQILKAFLFQVANKMCGSPGVRLSQWRKNLISLFHELDNANLTVLTRLTESKDHTSDAIIESLYEAAVEFQDTALVSRLLEAGRDANALLSICWYGKRSVTVGKARFVFGRELLHSMTALQYAATTCDLELAKTLMDAGAKADLGNPTPLQILCTSSGVGHPDALDFAHLLVSNCARVNTLSTWWVSPLECAVLSRNSSLVCFLLKRGAVDSLHSHRGGDDYNKLFYEPLEITNRTFLLPSKKSTLAPTSALQLAIIKRESSIAKILISSIINQEDGGSGLLEESLITACVTGDQDIAQVILENLDSQLGDGKDLIISAFFAAAWDMNCRIAQLLIEHKTVRRTLQSSCRAIFQAAALYGNISLIVLLQSNGFDMNSGSSLPIRLLDKHKHGSGSPLMPPLISSTPLGCAVWMGHKDVIEFFLDLGTDVVDVDLITAIRSGSSELVTRVLDQGSDINDLYDEQNALDIAIRERIGLTTIRKLINAGASPQGHELIDAVRSDDQEVIDFFLPSCNMLATNRGESVLEAACCTGNLEIACLYFDCGGVYGSRALFLALSRAVKTHDYRIIEKMVPSRPPGPVDEYEASALALSIRMDDTILMDILLHDDFESSSSLSIYCGVSIRNEEDIEDIVDTIEEDIHPLDFEDPRLSLRYIMRGPCLEKDQDCKDPCPDRFSPLLVAAARAQEGVARKMLAHGYLPEPYLFDMIYEPSFPRKGVRDMMVSAYVSRIPNVEDQDWHQVMLLTALKHGMNFEIIQKHFAKLPSLDFEDDLHGDPLSTAARSGSCNNMKAVLEAGATADARKWPLAHQAFLAAIIQDRPDMLSILMQYGADINYDPSDTLRIALSTKDFRTAVFLLDHGLNVNAPAPFKDKQSRITLLELAARFGQIDAVELLLSHGLEIQGGRNRIHFIRAVALAIRGCHYAVAKLLRERGGWNLEDAQLAKTPQGIEVFHGCPCFVYDDPTLEGCSRCQSDMDNSHVYGSSGGDKDVATSSHSYEAGDEHSVPQETSTGTGDMSVLDFESEFIDYDQTDHMPEWPLVPCNQQALGLDTSMLDIGSEFNHHQHTNDIHEWPVIPYGQQDIELDAIVQGLLMEDGIIS
jgi:ankyrin repeat protein